ncbi:MAG: ABC transporter ATP-binding protein [Limnochordia bacterium]|nr:ABC transporter ATP-binding protein [Limnochordia bacterium]
MIKQRLLEVENLHTYFYLDNGVLKAINGISFGLEKGETFALVGESGCGKSLTANSIMGLVPTPGKVVEGRILLEGEDLLQKSKKEMRQVRGSRIAMVFQEPMTALNPVFTIGWQIVETLKYHQKDMTQAQARERAIELLDLLRIPLPRQRFREYPHQLSGGMRQRVVIAIALACNPDLLICDEPTTALDVTVQAQILDLLGELQDELGMSIIMITHNLGVVSEMADRVGIMYAGKIVEQRATRELFTNPHHPYTEALLNSVPQIVEGAEEHELYQIRGMVPNLLKEHQGCLFAPRCDYAKRICFSVVPKEKEVGGGKVVCHRYDEEVDFDALSS